jgi:hypothetical protein
MSRSDAPSHALPEGPSLNDLLRRVESATGPDRELDVDLCAALVYLATPPTRLAEGWTLDYGPSPSGKGRVMAYAVRGDQRVPHASESAADLTASIDAALALVERRGWRLRSLDASVLGRPSVMLQSCEDRRFDDEDEQRGGWAPEYAGALAKTIPTAILAALLKALQAQAAQGNRKDGASLQGAEQ